jgi:glycosyltransferase involved in cell wall biosynthesis
MNALARDFRPDVVNCHRGEAFVLWALLKRRHGFALVRTRGDSRPPRSGVINRLLHREAADAVIATNSAIARHFADGLGVPPDRTHVVPGGVDTARFHPDEGIRRAVRAELGFADNAVVVGLVGRMDEVKGIRETVTAFARAAHSGAAGAERLRFLLIGFPSRYDETDLADWLAGQGLGRPGDRVLVTGRVERPEDYIRALDMGILASLGSEAIARAALEIMACGVPLAASRVGVMPDILPAAFLFAPGDIQAMADMLRQSLNPEWRAALQKICLERMMAPSGFRTEVFREQTLAVYRAALGHPDKNA